MTDTTDEPTGGQDPLGQARSAVEAGSFQEALTALTAAGPAASTAEGIELLAHAAYGAGEFERAVGAFEDLHALHLAAGELVEAGRAAALVAMYLMMDTGLMTPVRAWLRRAERMVADRDDTPVHALIAMTRTYERLISGDVEAAALHARQAVELGERHGVQPAVIIGSVAGARMHIFRGDIETGLDELDDIAVTLLSGAVDSLTTGMALCELICAMQGLAMYDRAAEWTQAMEQWRQGTAFGGINGRCRVHRAEMLRVSGPCDEAEEEALRACEELRPWMRREFGWPLAELGNIRLRKGDLAGAEEAYLAAYENAWTPHPGLALVRLAQGDVTGAAALIDEAVAHPFDAPSKECPPFGPLRRAPLLDAQVEVAVAAGDLATARGAADELDDIATGFPTAALRAMADLAQGRVLLATGELEPTMEACQRAVNGWAAVGAPFESAVARSLLAEARIASGLTESATLDRRAALTAFEQFGATARAQEMRDLLEGTRESAASPPAIPHRPAAPQRRRALCSAATVTPGRSAIGAPRCCCGISRGSATSSDSSPSLDASSMPSTWSRSSAGRFRQCPARSTPSSARPAALARDRSSTIEHERPIGGASPTSTRTSRTPPG